MRIAVASSRYTDIKNYCIRSVIDWKGIAEVNRILDILGEGRFLSGKEQTKIQLMKDTVSAFVGRKSVGPHEMCLLVLSDDSRTKYALHHYDDNRVLVKELILDLQH